MNSKSLHQYATETLTVLRASRHLDDHILKDIVNFDFINQMNRVLTLNDKAMVLKLCDSENSGARRLGIALTRGFHDDPDIYDTLVQMWYSPQDAMVKAMLLWFLLDYKTLPSELRDDVYSFIKHHWDTFKKHCLGYGGSAERLLEIAKSRLSGTFFPSTKIFAYLCSGSISPNRDEARSFFGTIHRSQRFANSASRQ